MRSGALKEKQLSSDLEMLKQSGREWSDSSRRERVAPSTHLALRHGGVLARLRLEQRGGAGRAAEPVAPQRSEGDEREREGGGREKHEGVLGAGERADAEQRAVHQSERGDGHAE